MQSKTKTSIKELLIVYGAGLILTILSIVYFSIQGYPLVNTAAEVLNLYTPPIYMIPIFFPFGMLLGEIIWLWRQKISYKILLLYSIEVLIIGIVSFVRYEIAIPFSGHAIVIFYYLAHQVFNNRNKYKLRIIIGILVLVITFIFKGFIWNDYITFILGGLLGCVVWFLGFLIQRYILRNSEKS